MRYFLDQDNSSHWYLVPVINRKEWNAWRDLSPDDEKGWDEPAYARRISGPWQITFENWEIQGG